MVSAAAKFYWTGLTGHDQDCWLDAEIQAEGVRPDSPARAQIRAFAALQEAVQTGQQHYADECFYAALWRRHHEFPPREGAEIGAYRPAKIDRRRVTMRVEFKFRPGHEIVPVSLDGVLEGEIRVSPTDGFQFWRRTTTETVRETISHEDLESLIGAIRHHLIILRAPRAES